jgi:nucleoside phosphorylase
LLAILTFVPEEARPLLRHLKHRRRLPVTAGRAWYGDLDGIPAAIATVGMGGRRAATGLDGLRAVRPVKALAVCGVAAALDPALAVADLLVADDVLDEAGTRLRSRPLAAPVPAGWPPFRTASLLGVDRVLVTAAEKRAVARAAAADMESFGAARAATAAGLPWCALRAVSDAADDDLPLDFNRCTDADGQLRLGRLLRELVAHPAALPGLLRLGANTARAADALARLAVVYLPAWYRGLGAPEGLEPPRYSGWSGAAS